MLSNAKAKDFLDNDLLDGSKWLAFTSDDPTRAGVLTSEISDSGTGYERAEVTGLFTATDLTTRLSVLNAILTLATPTDEWAAMRYALLMDSATVGAGTMLAKTRLTKDIIVEVGVPKVFLPGQIKFLVP